MRLSEPDSSGEPGIDVVAQPPGKRLQNVLLLSGGEKAMTALALLIAIFRYQPSPFCILDEVDAPLDEANVGRFTKLVVGNERGHAVHRRDAQPENDGDGVGPVRRDDAGARRLETGVRPLGRARGRASRDERRVTYRGNAENSWKVFSSCLLCARSVLKVFAFSPFECCTPHAQGPHGKCKTLHTTFVSSAEISFPLFVFLLR